MAGTAVGRKGSNSARANAPEVRLAEPRILQPGRNCWCAAHADRLSFIVDTADYFASVATAIMAARHSVTIIAWDFDSRVQLLRNGPTLRELLVEALERTPGLQVRVLVWDAAPFYGPGGTWSLLKDVLVTPHARLQVKLDPVHPAGSCHHQKLVVVDGSLAFVGGVDLTMARWDVPGHALPPEQRIDACGPYPPFHDLVAAVQGEAARVVERMALDRWATATGEILAPAPGGGPCWPDHLPVELERIRVAFARTLPRRNRRNVREIERALLDMLASARQWVFMETQYFTSEALANVLGDLLSRPVPPEILVLASKRNEGWVEQHAMRRRREQLMAELIPYDREQRLRVLGPIVNNEPLNLHSKLMIVDGRLLKLGSANLNNRSMGADSEFDLLVEAEDWRTEQVITALRDRLLGEHMGIEAKAMAERIACVGLLAAAQGATYGGHRLEALPISERNETIETLAAAAADPAEPIDPRWFDPPTTPAERDASTAPRTTGP